MSSIPQFPEAGLPRVARTATAMLALVMLVSAAAADTSSTAPRWTDDWFVEASAGMGIVPGGDITLAGIRYEAEYKTGVVVQGAVGRKWTPRLSTKLEWFYRSNEVSSLVAGTARISGGDLASTNAFLTTTYRFGPPFEFLGIAPYAGLGAGILQEVDVDLDGFGAEEFSASGRFAYQWLVGLERAVGPQGRLFVEGRAVAAGEQELQSSTGPRRLKVEYDTWGLIVGLRWSF